MAPRDRHLGQLWQLADEGEILVVGEDRTRLGPEEQLGHTARRQPVRGGGHVRHLAAEDPPPLLLVRKCRRDYVAFSFNHSSKHVSSPLRVGDRTHIYMIDFARSPELTLSI